MNLKFASSTPRLISVYSLTNLLLAKASASQLAFLIPVLPTVASSPRKCSFAKWNGFFKKKQCSNVSSSLYNFLKLSLLTGKFLGLFCKFFLALARHGIPVSPFPSLFTYRPYTGVDLTSWGKDLFTAVCLYLLWCHVYRRSSVSPFWMNGILFTYSKKIYLLTQHCKSTIFQ